MKASAFARCAKSISRLEDYNSCCEFLETYCSVVIKHCRGKLEPRALSVPEPERMQKNTNRCSLWLLVGSIRCSFARSTSAEASKAITENKAAQDSKSRGDTVVHNPMETLGKKAVYVVDAIAHQCLRNFEKGAF